MSVILTCQTCAAPVPIPDAPPGFDMAPPMCHNCPPIKCDRCGLMDHKDTPCDCWLDVADIPHADLKAMLAADGIGVGTDGVWHTMGGADG